MPSCRLCENGGGCRRWGNPTDINSKEKEEVARELERECGEYLGKKEMETVSNAAGRTSPLGVARALVRNLFSVLKSGQRTDGQGLRTQWSEKVEAEHVNLPF